MINRKAISWANEVIGHPLLEGKEPLNVAAEMVFLAGKQFGIKKLADYIHDEIGVSKPYLYNHQEEYTRILKGLTSFSFIQCSKKEDEITRYSYLHIENIMLMLGLMALS